MRRIFLVLALVLVLIPATASAEFMSVLVGFQSVSFGADLGEYYDIPAGPGGAVLVSLDLGFPLDFRAGRRTAKEGSSGGDVTYDWMEAGLRLPLGKEGSAISSDWFFGVGSYDLEIGSSEFDTAPGGYLGIGVQEVVSDKYIGRFEVKGVYWKSDTFNTDAPSLNLALYFGLQL